MGLINAITNKFTHWLSDEKAQGEFPLCDFDRLSFEIRQCDVLLVEGRSRVSNVIKNITHSPWTHAALYIGRLHEITNPAVQEVVQQHYNGDPSEQLLIEAMLGEGTIIVPLSKYTDNHLRICRPEGLSRDDASQVISHSVEHLGTDYDVRQILDFARFMYPYSIIPGRWRSSLFEYHAGIPTRTVCSTMIASAFAAVHFPILPVIHRNSEGKMQLFKRNTRLFTPRDFDYSPYFNIIKYPFLGFDDLAIYRRLPWDERGVVCNDENDCFAPPQASTTVEKKTKQTNTVINEQQEQLDKGEI